jgi:hypothetical protein
MVLVERERERERERMNEWKWLTCTKTFLWPGFVDFFRICAQYLPDIFTFHGTLIAGVQIWMDQDCRELLIWWSVIWSSQAWLLWYESDHVYLKLTRDYGFCITTQQNSEWVGRTGVPCAAVHHFSVTMKEFRFKSLYIYKRPFNSM